MSASLQSRQCFTHKYYSLWCTRINILLDLYHNSTLRADKFIPNSTRKDTRSKDVKGFAQGPYPQSIQPQIQPCLTMVYPDQGQVIDDNLNETCHVLSCICTSIKRSIGQCFRNSQYILISDEHPGWQDVGGGGKEQCQKSAWGPQPPHASSALQKRYSNENHDDVLQHGQLTFLPFEICEFQSL